MKKSPQDRPNLTNKRHLFILELCLATARVVSPFAPAHSTIRHRPATMTDYSANKVPELKKLLGERKLSAVGNKAELIARLQEDDRAKEAPAAKPSGS